ncbi:hypothetical protein [Methanocalculus sp. MC3]
MSDFTEKVGEYLTSSKIISKPGESEVFEITVNTTKEEDAAYDDWKAKQPKRYPKIIVNRLHIEEMTKQSLNTLHKRNEPPFVFVRSGQLCRVVVDETKRPTIRNLDVPSLRFILERLIRYNEAKYNPKTQEVDYHPSQCPKSVLEDVLAAPPSLWKCPPIAGIVDYPIIHPDGSIWEEEGYDPVSWLYYVGREGFVSKPVPEEPSDQDIKEAVDLLDDIFYDFPFVDQSSRANAYAALITAVIRPIIPGLVPVWVCDKPQAGSGATLLQEVVGQIAAGDTPAKQDMPTTKEEFQKVILSMLMGGNLINIIDNIDRKFSSGVLANLVTSEFFEGRVLGKSEMIRLKNRGFLMVNGNNLQIGGDMARRIFLSRIDPQTALPFLRGGFKHPNLLGWCQEKRGEIIAAIHTLVRAWIGAGRPKPDLPPLAKFEAWLHTVGGILQVAEVPSFLENARAVYEEADVELKQWEMFLETLILWGGEGNPFTVSALEKRIRGEADGRKERQSTIDQAEDASYSLLDVLPDPLADAWADPRQSFSRKMGNAFKAKVDRRYPSGLMLLRGGISHRATEWVVKRFEPEVSDRGVNELGEFVSAPTTRENRDDIRDRIRDRDGLTANSPNSQTPHPEGDRS